MIALVPSSESWVRAALAGLDTLLIDHAHCEKKAAGMAIRLLAKYPDWPALVHEMSRLAREELVHFERVLRELALRGVAFAGLSSANYAAELFAAVRPGQRRVDELLCCALIEARSHERFVLLAAALADCADAPGRRLAGFYEELAVAERRHGLVYVALAEAAAGAARAEVEPRLAALARHEAEVLARPGRPLRMHAGG